ncbi:hypothetical protein MPTK1_1g09030 [Marchantia polymorpha subsp. ruderalis]|uniref:Rubisco LSMT substrate-binding domain-containing protein n=2 Tax=Marchantia polymorpha TaxID=3197 RepID=A0AAF6AN50_MARPO|nr:hypothetical protein MARPO_0036s0143 [Marchantia polymorpha]BBM97870.1 hypothetical protein Mp_1g09030 [Marchantia polymorpha subsp. ruderalis]|eukprot:PTQ41171.1 hypothetical protein MARPO_0036s0143 [Marchantia polymorpha]
MNAEICRFWEWAQAQGCSMADLRVEGRSFFTREILPAGSTVFTVPFSILMHMDAAFDDKTFGEVYKKLSAAGASERIVLTLFVAVEKAKGENSFWFTYLSSLPQTFSTPLWFNEKELDIIRGTKVAASLSKDRAAFNQLVNFWAPSLHSTLTSRDESTNDSIATLLRTATQESSLLWARTVVLSRGFTLLLEGKHEVTLVPLFDLLDHSPSARVEWITDDAKREAKFISASELQGGVEVYNNYGQKANDELLQGYGFCLCPNPADVYYIRIGISPLQERPANCATSPEDDEKASRGDRQELMWRMGTSAEFALSLKQPLPDALLQTARICLLSDSEAYSAFGIGWNADMGAAELEISATEFQSISNLRELLLTSIAQFSGGLDVETDRKLLTQDCQAGDSFCHLTEKERFALMYRQGQKEIIHSTLQALGGRAASSLDTWAQCQGTPEIVMQTSDDTPNTYQKWLDDSGVTCDFIIEILTRVGDQPCLQLKKQCATGDILASVPSHLLFVSDCATSNGQQLPHPLTDLVKNLEDRSALKLLLLFEFGRGNDSLWAPYIKRLADHIDTRDYYKDDMLELLEGTNLMQELNDRIQHLQHEFGMVLKLLQDEHLQQVSSQTFTLERWLWADSVVERCALLVHSEEMYQSSREPHRRLVLAPVLSSLPSALNGAVVECVMESKSCALVIRALSTMRAGSLLCIPQSGLDNESRILQFVTETVVLDNEHDFVEIVLGSSPEDPYSDLKEKLSMASGLGPIQYLKRSPKSTLALASIALHSLDSDEDFDKCGAFDLLKLVSEAKSAASRGEESWCAPTGEDVGSYEHFDKYRQQAKGAHSAAASAAEQFVRTLQSPSRTRRAASTFRKLLQSVLSSIAGSSADDDRQLYARSGDAVCSYRAMLAYRHGQKEILEIWVRHLKQVLKEQTKAASTKRMRL